MKALVIGFGKMGMLHAATLRMLPGIDEVIIAEASPLIRRAAATFTPGHTVIADFRDVLTDPALNCAVIATPTSSHASIFRALTPHLRAIFIEKPFASNAEDGVAAINALQEHGGSTAVMIGHCLRFSAVFGEAKRLLDAGALGNLHGFEGSMFSSDVLRPTAGWRSKPGVGSGGGVLLDLGSHLIDMVRSFFGTPECVTGDVFSVVSPGTDDAFASEWTYPGFAGKIEASWSRPDFRKATLEITVRGDNGRLTVSDDAIEIRLLSDAAGLRAGTVRIPVTTLEQPVAFDLAGPMYTRQLAAWIASAAGRPGNVNTLPENVVNLRITDAIRTSRGSRVRLL